MPYSICIGIDIGIDMGIDIGIGIHIGMGIGIGLCNKCTCICTFICICLCILQHTPAQSLHPHAMPPAVPLIRVAWSLLGGALGSFGCQLGGLGYYPRGPNKFGALQTDGL